MSKEFKIGILALTAIALLYYGFNFLRGVDFFSPTIRYFVIYPNVSGLNISNPIYFNGLPVGRVSQFELQQSKNQIVVSLDIDRKVVIGKDTKAILSNDGLFGSKAVVLDVGHSPKRLQKGDTLDSEIHGDLLSHFEPVADNLNTTITKVNTLLDHLNAMDIKGTVDTLKYAIGTIAYKASHLNVEEPIHNINELVIGLNDRSGQLEGVLESSQRLLDSLTQLELKETVNRLNESLGEINTLLASVREENGTIGKLITDDSMYDNLAKLLQDIDQLVIHLNNYPKDFLKPLGRKHKKLRGIKKE